MTVFMLAGTTEMDEYGARWWALNSLGHDLGYADYTLLETGTDRIVFRRRTRSVAVWIVTVLLFPVGLLIWAFVPKDSIITVLITNADEDEHCMIEVSGDARPRVIEGVQHRVEQDLDRI